MGEKGGFNSLSPRSISSFFFIPFYFFFFFFFFYFPLLLLLLSIVFTPIHELKVGAGGFGIFRGIGSSD